MTIEENYLFRSPRFFIRKEDKKMFHEDKTNQCWMAEDGERIDGLAYPIIESQNKPSFPRFFNRYVKVVKINK